MTNQELKNKILTEFHQTGRIDGLYFGIKSQSKANPVKEYIKACLFKSTLLQTNGLQQNEIIDDCYQQAFFELANMNPDKFIELYNSGKVKGSSLIAVTLKIIQWKCFSRDKRSTNPKHSLVSWLAYGSVFDPGNYSITPMETDSDDDDQFPSLIIFDDEDQCSQFESDYGFKPEDILDQLSPEARFVFYNLLENRETRSTIKAAYQ